MTLDRKPNNIGAHDYLMRKELEDNARRARRWRDIVTLLVVIFCLIVSYVWSKAITGGLNGGF